MTTEKVFKNYLVSFDSNRLKHIYTDTLIIGSGVGGLSAAIHAAEGGSVLIVSKSKINENSTEYAQGGIAACISPKDSFTKHINDTLDTGHGLCDKEIVSGVVREGPERIEELIKWGANFDKENGELVCTKEGGHSFTRILRARGDSTGKEIEDTLINVVLNHPNIEVFEYMFAIDFLIENNSCKGILAWREKEGKIIIRAKSVVLASGGCGQVYRETSNPEVSTGDGIAMAYRAGAVLQDLEFMQFHPTTLYVVGAERILISETVRGEGGILRNKYGERFMPKYDPKAELAPRDIVSKSILHEIRKTNYTHVFLDVRHIPKEKLCKRFPKINKLCASFGIDITKELIPVHPSAHYIIGGVKVDKQGRTNIKNLYASGEVACSGLHGANRLGSNSLLEGLVFGNRIGKHISSRSDNKKTGDLSSCFVQKSLQNSRYGELDLEDVINSLRSIMWRNIGIEREGKYIAEAVRNITHWSKYIIDNEFSTPLGWEVQNMLTVTRLICISASKRSESRGVHYRLDFPECDDEKWKKHITVCKGKYNFESC
ncbi:MAG: L-aspartate oxidase [Candidatus Scalindua sp. AMX11]|nr:MAG: L-aspartate oxidase [Candidatus Scalindua sp.]NOG84997.1 L-aspartate oxidase [Planctomycetota bacterium]RZV93053.1 MAG: L-aspartate oxidase [Candidatus Scalindua sp. SCAELEC01]TDE66675.1 MAG: L-aspartate oxidase [Candidatus Scalindua sp. AMX11]GJQ57979.1 MAG: L-aspartate oxidase [Candidatus Scalindua sp.]